MTITAIILNYNNYQDVRECLLSLYRQDLPACCHVKIIIIDNASADDGTKRLQAEFPENIYIYNAENLGFAKGVNQALDLARDFSDYFLLVNNDAELECHCLSGLLKESSNKAIVGPAIYYKDQPEVIWQGGGIYSKLRMNVVVPFKNQRFSDSDAIDCEFLSGCVLLIPKSAIETLRRFDDNFFFYGEDLDFCLRAKVNQIPIRYCPRLRATHNIKKINISRTNEFVLENLSFSFIVIIRKHFSHLIAYGLFLFIFVYTPFRLYQIISGGSKPKNIFSWLRGGFRALTKKYEN